MRLKVEAAHQSDVIIDIKLESCYLGSGYFSFLRNIAPLLSSTNLDSMDVIWHK